MILEYTDVTADRTETVDAVIIGSGCGGATVARELVEAGHSVLMLERGGYYTAARGDYDQRVDDMFARIDGGRGLDGTPNGDIALTYGNNVGGASVHYWADSWRVPADRVAEWEDMGVSGHGLDTLNPLFDLVEQRHNVHPATPDHYNRMNLLFDKGLGALGWHAEPVRQARKDCAKSGHCYQGCSFDRKMAQTLTNIPAMLEGGGRLFADCQVDQITRNAGGRATGVAASFLDRRTGRPSGHRLTVRAKAVVLAAGGFGSALVWLQSKLPNGNGQVGRNFFCNPCPYLHAIFPDYVVQWTDIPTATGTMDFRRTRYDGKGKYLGGGFLLHPNQLQPELLAITLPGFGIAHRQIMDVLPYLGGAISWIDDEMPGQVRLDKQGRPIFDYRVRGVDVLKLRDALKKQAHVLLAAGATEVIVPDTVGTRIRDEKEIALLDTIAVTDGALPMLGAPHPAGTLRMGDDARYSVVAANHEAHEVPGLFVADPSAFPRPPSVDPSLTIMAWAMVATQGIKAALA